MVFLWSQFSASAQGCLAPDLSATPAGPEQTDGVQLKRCDKHHRPNTLKCKAATPYLRPLPVAAGHVYSGDVLEELLGGDEVGQAGEELSHVDEVHAGQDILVEPQQAQRRAEQELLAVSAEHVPHATRQVQRQRLTVQGEDPGKERCT